MVKILAKVVTTTISGVLTFAISCTSQNYEAQEIVSNNIKYIKKKT